MGRGRRGDEGQKAKGARKGYLGFVAPPLAETLKVMLHGTIRNNDF